MASCHRKTARPGFEENETMYNNCVNYWNRSNSRTGTIQMNCCWLSGMHGDFDANLASFGRPWDHRSTCSVERPSLRHGFLIGAANNTIHWIARWLFANFAHKAPHIAFGTQQRSRIRFEWVKIPDAFFLDTETLKLQNVRVSGTQLEGLLLRSTHGASLPFWHGPMANHKSLTWA